MAKYPVDGRVVELESKVSGHGYIVLCYRGLNYFDRFVTWYSDLEGNYSLGHYFHSFRDAAIDFHKRS